MWVPAGHMAETYMSRHYGSTYQRHERNREISHTCTKEMGLQIADNQLSCPLISRESCGVIQWFIIAETVLGSEPTLSLPSIIACDIYAEPICGPLSASFSPISVSLSLHRRERRSHGSNSPGVYLTWQSRKPRTGFSLVSTGV